MLDSFLRRAVTVALLGVCALCSDAHAAVMTLTQSQTKSADPKTGRADFVVNQFDPALGTLISISLGMSGDAYTYNTSVYQNMSGITQTGTANILPKVLLDGSIFAGDGMATSQAVGPNVPVLYNVAPNGFFSYSGDGPAYSISTAAVTNASVRAAYTGTGTRPLLTTIGGSVAFVPDSGSYNLQPTSFGGGALGDITASVTYTYDAVPEPATASLLAIAAAVALCRRRRKTGSS